MAQKNYGIQQGVTLYGQEAGKKYFLENFGGDAPGSGYGVDGDFAVDTFDGEFYKKVSGTWEQSGISARINRAVSGISFQEGVQYLTSTNVSAFSGTGNKTLDGQTISISTGDRIISTANNVLYIAGSGAWTTETVADKDAFFVDQVLSDPDFQKGKAIYQYQSSSFVMLADFDFEDASTIGFNEYSKPASGDATSVDGAGTVQAAIENLDTSVDNLISQIGVNRGDTDLGSFSGDNSYLSNDDVKTAIQDVIDLASYHISTTTTSSFSAMDSCSFSNVEWMVDFTQGANSYKAIVSAVGDGNNACDFSVSNILELGSAIAGLEITVTSSGGTMSLNAKSTSSSTVNATRRAIYID